MLTQRIWTLGRDSKQTPFSYTGSVKTGAQLLFSGKPRISSDFFKAILAKFRGETISGGFSMTAPTQGGLGEWVRDNSSCLNGRKLTPRHASFIAAILQHEEYITSHLQGNAISLTFPDDAESE